MWNTRTSSVLRVVVPKFSGLNVCVKAIHTPRNTIPPQRRALHSIRSETCVRSAVCDVVGSLRLCIFIIRFAMSLRCHRNTHTVKPCACQLFPSSCSFVILLVAYFRSVSRWCAGVLTVSASVDVDQLAGKRWRGLQVPDCFSDFSVCGETIGSLPLETIFETPKNLAKKKQQQTTKLSRCPGTSFLRMQQRMQHVVVCGAFLRLKKIPVIDGRWSFHISTWMSEALVVEVALCASAEGAWALQGGLFCQRVGGGPFFSAVSLFGSFGIPPCTG